MVAALSHGQTVGLDDHADERSHNSIVERTVTNWREPSFTGREVNCGNGIEGQEDQLERASESRGVSRETAFESTAALGVQSREIAQAPTNRMVVARGSLFCRIIGLRY
jgi:hypothetical protein